MIFDDWLRDPVTPTQALDWLEVLDDRYGRSATLIATQLPAADRHASVPDPTQADAILDRLVRNFYIFRRIKRDTDEYSNQCQSMSLD